MKVIAQRWVEGTPSQSFGKMVLEALVVAPMAQGSVSHGLYSAFYDAQAGHTLQQSFLWWHRGFDGLAHVIEAKARDMVAQNWKRPV